MYSENGVLVDFEEINKLVETADVFTVGFATFLERLLIRDRAAAREQVDRMLAWRPERIVLAHGDIIEAGGEEVLRRAYAWL